MLSKAPPTIGLSACRSEADAASLAPWRRTPLTSTPAHPNHYEAADHSDSGKQGFPLEHAGESEPQQHNEREFQQPVPQRCQRTGQHSVAGTLAHHEYG